MHIAFSKDKLFCFWGSCSFSNYLIFKVMFPCFRDPHPPWCASIAIFFTLVVFFWFNPCGNGLSKIISLSWSAKSYKWGWSWMGNVTVSNNPNCSCFAVYFTVFFHTVFLQHYRWTTLEIFLNFRLVGKWLYFDASLRLVLYQHGSRPHVFLHLFSTLLSMDQIR